jgi:WD40 repeat protein
LTSERIQAEIERIKNNPVRIDMIKAFNQFVISQSHVLLKFGQFPFFSIQRAYNTFDSGPISDKAQSLIAEENKTPMLLYSSCKRLPYNPLNALIRTLEGHTEGVESVCVTPDGGRAISTSCDNTVRVWDLESGECMAVSYAGSCVVSISNIKFGSRFVIGTTVGRVLIIQVRNIPALPSFVTGNRLWLFPKTVQEGMWSQEITTVCW